MVRFKHLGAGLVGLGVIALLVWALLKYLWIFGLIFIIIGIVVYLLGTAKKE